MSNKEKPFVYDGEVADFWENVWAFHKKNNATGEGRAKAEARVAKIIPTGMISVAEIDAALNQNRDSV